MALEDLTGTSFGPFPWRTCAEKVAEYVEVTADDPDRWTASAPPSLAGAALFVVAPHLLARPEVADRFVVHGDQSFTWHGAIPIEVDLAVSGQVSRVRERGGAAFVGFELVLAAGEDPLVEGSSTFVMTPAQEGPVGGTEDQDEPPPLAGSTDRPVENAPLPPVGEQIPPLARSASRADLVRYAGASRDWNPIHWDHGAAVGAGLPGVVVHGLLQAAWICQAAARFRPGPAPLSSARFRFRAPLRPAVPVQVEGTVGEYGLDLALTSGETRFVTASLALAG